MKSLRTLPVALGVIALGCWAAYSAFLMLDLYLQSPVAGVALRLLVPCAALCNLVGIIPLYLAWRMIRHVTELENSRRPMPAAISK